MPEKFIKSISVTVKTSRYACDQYIGAFLWKNKAQISVFTTMVVSNKVFDLL